jgi:hypothetical protein
MRPVLRLLAGSRPNLTRPQRLSSFDQMAASAFTLPSVHRWAGTVTASSAGAPGAGTWDGSGYAHVYLHGPCTGR